MMRTGGSHTVSGLKGALDSGAKTIGYSHQHKDHAYRPPPPAPPDEPIPPDPMPPDDPMLPADPLPELDLLPPRAGLLPLESGMFPGSLRVEFPPGRGCDISEPSCPIDPEDSRSWFMDPIEPPLDPPEFLAR